MQIKTPEKNGSASPLGKKEDSPMKFSLFQMKDDKILVNDLDSKPSKKKSTVTGPMIKHLSALPVDKPDAELKIAVRKNSYEDPKMKRNRSLIPKIRHSEDLNLGAQNLKVTFDQTMNIDLNKKPLFIGVSGGTASGKTSVCEIIQQEFGQMCCMVPFDSFYKGLSDKDHNDSENYNFDSPNALDFDLAYEAILKLLQYEDVKIPIYDFATHKRKPGEFQTLKCQPLLIFEGILALYEKRFRDLMDLTIFVLTDDDIRLSRRIQRDTAERGRKVQDVLRQYNKFVKKSYDEFIKPTMKYADIIVPRGKSNTKGIEFVVNNLKLQIPYDDLENISQKGSSHAVNQWASKEKKSQELEDGSPRPALTSIKEMISPDPNMEGKIQLEQKVLKPKDEKKSNLSIKKLINEQNRQMIEEEGLSEILIDYLLQILMKDRISLETLLKQQNQQQQDGQISGDRTVFNIDNGNYAQAATHFAPELLSKESMRQLTEDIKDSCDDIIWVYTFVTNEKIEDAIATVNGKKFVNIITLLLLENEDDGEESAAKEKLEHAEYLKLNAYFKPPTEKEKDEQPPSQAPLSNYVFNSSTRPKES